MSDLAQPRETRARHFGRRAFHLLNRWLMIPMTRAGLGAWLGSPIGSWICLLRVRGRKTGLVREVPLSYVIADGSAWVMAGFGGSSDWLRNAIANPRIDVTLPSRHRISCTAQLVDDPATRRRVVPVLFRAFGIWGYLGGADPWRSSAEQILAATVDVPLLRLRPDGEPILGGPDDPGGQRWMLRQLAVAAVLVEVAAGLIWYNRRRNIDRVDGPAGNGLSRPG